MGCNEEVSQMVEEVTNGEVVLTHVVVIGLLLVIGLAGWIGG